MKTRTSLKDFFFPDVRERLYTEELMDRPDASLKKLKKTIDQFDLLNHLFSSAVSLFRRCILPELLRDPQRVWTFWDLGAGGADIDRALVRFCRRQGLKVRFLALDIDDRIIPWAREKSQAYPEIEVFKASALELTSLAAHLEVSPDWVLSNHMLHHLDYPDVLQVLEEAERVATYGYLLNDLRRSTWAYAGYTIFTGLFVHGSLAFYDGRLSIQRGFSLPELENLVSSWPENQRPQIFPAAPARAVLWRQKPRAEGMSEAI